jgi:hypothetical protein
MDHKGHIGFMLLALAAGTVVRVQGMGDALNHDEVYTWEAFASRSFATIVTHYPVPNNHIFHSILVRVTTGFIFDIISGIKLDTSAGPRSA